MKSRSVFCKIDDKHIPIYRVLWISDLPHFCGEDDCEVEGLYEIRLENEEPIWGNRQERDALLKSIEDWQGGSEDDWS